MNSRLKVYFIHSEKIDYNEELYLPVIRSEFLSNHEMIFRMNIENKEKYYKDLLDYAELFVVLIDEPTIAFNLELKDAIISKKPILALAKSEKKYDSKYNKLIKNIISYKTEGELKHFIETFVKSYENRIIGGVVDPTVILGEIN